MFLGLPPKNTPKTTNLNPPKRRFHPGIPNRRGPRRKNKEKTRGTLFESCPKRSFCPPLSAPAAGGRDGLPAGEVPGGVQGLADLASMSLPKGRPWLSLGNILHVAYCGLVGNPNLTANISTFCSPSNQVLGLPTIFDHRRLATEISLREVRVAEPCPFLGYLQSGSIVSRDKNQ